MAPAIGACSGAAGAGASDSGSDARHAHDGCACERDAGPKETDGRAPAGDASADAAGDEAAPAPDSGATALPLGTLSVTNPSVSCPPGVGAMGASCMSVTVSCPMAPDIDATIAVALPAGTAKGTIVGHAGGAGTGWFAGGPEGKGFGVAYPEAGFRFVQIAWQNDWASGTGSIKAAACRPATAFRWMFDHIHGGSTTTGFCGTGTSGGSAAMSYSLTAYGLSDVWDYMLLGAGPAPARIDYGCDPSLYTGPARDLCPELTNAPYAYVPGVAKIADGWEGTMSCGLSGASSADIAKWASDSVAFPGADLTYPKTGMSFWFCTSMPNETTGQGSFLIDALKPKNVTPDVHCYGGPTSPSPCTNEYVFQDPKAQSAAVTEMTANCVANH